MKCGYFKLRNRKRVKGTRDKWDAGCSKWQDQEWMNPHDEVDIHELRTRLSECRIFSPSLDVNIISESIIAYLKSIWISEGAIDVSDVKPKVKQEPCQQVPQMHGIVRYRLFLGEKSSRLWPAGLDGVPPCFGPVFCAFYQVVSPNPFCCDMLNHTGFTRISFIPTLDRLPHPSK